MKQLCILISLLLIIGIGLVSCKKGPAEMRFVNLKASDLANDNLKNAAQTAIKKDNKPRSDFYTECNNGITKKPGIIFDAKLKQKLGVSKITFQVVGDNGRVIFSNDFDTDPGMESLSSWYNLPGKGKYVIQYIAKDEIITRGTITYE